MSYILLEDAKGLYMLLQRSTYHQRELHSLKLLEFNLSLSS